VPVSAPVPDAAKAVIQAAVDQRLASYEASHRRPSAPVPASASTVVSYLDARAGDGGLLVHVSEQTTESFAAPPSAQGGPAGSTPPPSGSLIREAISLHRSGSGWTVTDMVLDAKCGLPPGWAHFPGAEPGQPVAPGPNSSPGSC
jgi:hypothetical protein